MNYYTLSSFQTQLWFHLLVTIFLLRTTEKSSLLTKILKLNTIQVSSIDVEIENREEI